MKNTSVKKSLLSIAILILSTNVMANNFHFVHIKQFPRLESFKSIDEFDTYITNYENTCLKATTGKESNKCFIHGKIWLKELKTYYKKLGHQLKYKEQVALRETQKSWQAMYEQSVKFNRLLSLKFSHPYSIEYKNKAKIEANMIRARALVLKNWLEQGQKTN